MVGWNVDRFYCAHDHSAQWMLQYPLDDGEAQNPNFDEAFSTADGTADIRNPP